VSVADDVPSRDDVDAADSGLVGRPVVERLLGGKVIDETDV
jgi:DNA polymerase-3 subunit gamma/tau